METTIDIEQRIKDLREAQEYTWDEIKSISDPDMIYDLQDRMQEKIEEYKELLSEYPNARGEEKTSWITHKNDYIQFIKELKELKEIYKDEE